MLEPSSGSSGPSWSIRRVQIAEGWLDGLDVEFDDGLNVLIGGRGVGKTSLIELVRFCLGVRAHTDRIDTKATGHALAVLGSGEITVTLALDDGPPVTVTRTAKDPEPRFSSPYRSPLIFSQGEIESIGLEARGRKSLVDNFLDSDREAAARAAALREEIEALMQRSHSLREAMGSLDEEIKALQGVDERLTELRDQQKVLLASQAEGLKHQAELDRLDQENSRLVKEGTAIRHTEQALLQWWNSLDRVLRESPPAPPKPVVDDLSEAHRLQEEASRQVREAREKIKVAMDVAASVNASHVQRRTTLESAARELRQTLERLQEGAGALAAKVSTAEDRLAFRSNMIEEHKQIAQALRDETDERRALIDALESIRQSRFDRRRQLVDKLNVELAPAIRLAVEQSSGHASYEAALVELLRGSGLKYKGLAERLVPSISPRELVAYVEAEDAQSISEIAGISLDRARRFVVAAQSSDLGPLLTCEVEDGVRITLLTGTDYQDSEELSTGQRCTAVLPILLGVHNRTLILDQPEDNLDNAFVVQTVIRSLRGRTRGQLICATHNPNIPVLGEAAKVILLGSDGKRGFVEHCGALDHPESVRAITTLMEGGMDAFRKRAEFYRSSGK